MRLADAVVMNARFLGWDLDPLGARKNMDRRSAHLGTLHRAFY